MTLFHVGCCPMLVSAALSLRNTLRPVRERSFGNSGECDNEVRRCAPLLCYLHRGDGFTRDEEATRHATPSLKRRRRRHREDIALATFLRPFPQLHHVYSTVPHSCARSPSRFRLCAGGGGPCTCKAPLTCSRASA